MSACYPSALPPLSSMSNLKSSVGATYQPTDRSRGQKSTNRVRPAEVVWALRVSIK